MELHMQEFPLKCLDVVQQTPWFSQAWEKRFQTVINSYYSWLSRSSHSASILACMSVLQSWKYTNTGPTSCPGTGRGSEQGGHGGSWVKPYQVNLRALICCSLMPHSMLILGVKTLLLPYCDCWWAGGPVRGRYIPCNVLISNIFQVWLRLCEVWPRLLTPCFHFRRNRKACFPEAIV